MPQVGRWNGIQYDEYGRVVSPKFNDVRDYLDYVDSLGEAATSPTMQEAAKVRSNPEAWQIGPGGNLQQKPSWLARNIGWLGPAIVTGGAAGLGALGGAAASGASGAASGAAGGALPATIPGSYASGLYASGGFGVPGATASGLAAGTSGLGTILPNAAAGNTLMNTIKEKLMSPQGIASLGGLIAALMAGRGGGDASAAQEALLQEALKRSQRVDPLHQAVTQLAFSRLPDSSRQGISLTGK